MHSSNLWRIIQPWASWIFFNKQKMSSFLMRKKLLPCGLPTEHFVLNGMVPRRWKPLSPCSSAPLSTDVNHQGSGKRIKGKVLQGRDSLSSNQRQKSMNKDACKVPQVIPWVLSTAWRGLSSIRGLWGFASAWLNIFKGRRSGLCLPAHPL